jgi:uncharacterized protein (TIGR02246 family)
MHRPFGFLATAALLALLSACEPKADGTAAAGTTATAGAVVPTDPAEVRKAIEAANQRTAAAIVANDPAAMVGNYADNAIVMQPGMAAMRGPAAIVDGFKQLSASMTVTAFDFNTEDVMVVGDMAVETGTYTMSITPKGGKPMDDKGKYLTVWKRQADGSWKIERDINNSDMAPPGSK